MSDELRLRIAIAEKMGWKHDPMHGPLEAQWLKPDGTRARELEPYTTDPAAALQLVEHMRREENGGWLTTHVDNDDGSVTWVFYQKHRANKGMTAIATTFPLAIAKAFAQANHLTP
jgi:hypothetical protein